MIGIPGSSGTPGYKTADSIQIRDFSHGFVIFQIRDLSHELFIFTATFVQGPFEHYCSTGFLRVPYSLLMIILLTPMNRI